MGLMVMPGAQNKGYAGEDRSFMLLFIISSVLALYWFYRDFLTGLSGLLLDEEYGYLGVSLVVAVLLLYLSLRQSGYYLGFSLLRLLSGLLLVDLSILFYVLAPHVSWRDRAVGGVEPRPPLARTVSHCLSPRLCPGLSPPSLFLIIPPPPGFFDWLTPWLSKVVGEIVSSLTGAEFAAGTGFGVIQVATPWGLVSFEVARACTGIVTMSSVLAVVPALLYLLAYSSKGAAV